MTSNTNKSLCQSKGKSLSYLQGSGDSSEVSVLSAKLQSDTSQKTGTFIEDTLCI